MILKFIKRTLSRYTDDKSVKDFERVKEQVDERSLVELLEDQTWPDEARMTAIARKLGQID